MMRIPQLGYDPIRLCFVPFALKDLVKKWLYNLAANSITSWDDFVKAFLNKFYPSIKPLSFEKNLMQFK